MLQTFEAINSRVEAVEVAVVDGGVVTQEHAFILQGSKLLVESEIFLALFRPAGETEIKKPAVPRKKRVPRKTAARPAVETQAPTNPKRVKVTRVPPAGQQGRDNKKTIAGTIREMLSHGEVLDLNEITAKLQKDFPETDERRASNNLYQMRSSGQLGHTEDGKYYLTEAK